MIALKTKQHPAVARFFSYDDFHETVLSFAANVEVREAPWRIVGRHPLWGKFIAKKADRLPGNVVVCATQF